MLCNACSAGNYLATTFLTCTSDCDGVNKKTYFILFFFTKKKFASSYKSNNGKNCVAVCELGTMLDEDTNTCISACTAGNFDIKSVLMICFFVGSAPDLS